MSMRYLYVGTFARARHSDTTDAAFGIYAFDADLDPVGMQPTSRPGWLAAHPLGPYLYAVNEVREFQGGSGGGVSAFRIDPQTGSLRPLNTQRTPPLPCHTQVEATGRFLLVATFGAGSVHLFPLRPDGSLGPEADAHRHAGSSVHPRRQTGPHAHAICLDPANRFVLVPDLGADRVFVYELDTAAGRLIPRPERSVALSPGSGPRHLTFDRQGRTAYLINEMSATISVFAYDGESGALREVQHIDLLPEGFVGLRSGAGIALHPDGRFLYATTRGSTSSGEAATPGLDAVVWFEVVADDGRLAFRGRTLTGGQIARDIAIDPDGGHLRVAHQGSGDIVSFSLEPRSGAPIAVGRPLLTPVPVCLRWVTSG
jgi:6-phosphogluconolactonase